MSEDQNKKAANQPKVADQPKIVNQPKPVGSPKSDASSKQGDQQPPAEPDQQLTVLQTQLQNARASELRAMADYQNLVRRTQDDRIKMIKFAGLSVVESLLQPLDHLAMAKDQLKDQGLDMVYQQFVQALQNEGLEEIEVLGKEFDPTTMEVVSKEVVANEKQMNKVVKVAQRGYKLNGEVIRHAKVVIGEVKK